MTSRDHIYLLASQHRVVVSWTEHALGSFADGLTRTITVPFVTDDATYAVALHELGHLVDPGGMDDRVCVLRSRLDHQPFIQTADRDVLCETIVEWADRAWRAELSAWEWARIHATHWTPLMQATMVMGLTSHLESQNSILAMLPAAYRTRLTTPLKGQP